MTTLAPESVRTSDPVIRSPARYHWTTAPRADKGKRRWTVEEQRRDSARSIPNFFQHNENESTIEIQTSLSRSPLRSDGVDETGDVNQTLVWVACRTTGRGGQTTIGSIRTLSFRRWNSRWVANVEREVGQPSIAYLKRRWST